MIQRLKINAKINIDVINILLVTFLWLFMIIIVNPLGDFPLNDDWVYGLSVKSILEEGDFRIPAHASANLFTQSFWGALFCSLFGFSFTTLRFSTLILGLIGILITYGIFRLLKTSPWISLLGALVLAFNPLYFGISNTFMTDIPFFAFFILSLYLIISGLKKESKIELIAGILISYLALLIRQIGMVVTFAFGCAYIVKKGISLKTLSKGFSPFLGAILIQIFYQKWLVVTERIPNLDNPQYSLFLKSFTDNILSSFLRFNGKILIALIYLGMFIFPFLIILFSIKFRTIRKNKFGIFAKLGIFAFLIVLLVKTGILLVKKHRMPLSGNVLTDFGMGPLTLRDTFLLNLNYPSIPLALNIFLVVITGIGLVGTILLIYYLLLAIIQILEQAKTADYQETKTLKTLILATIGIYLFLISLTVSFDRYFLPLLPLFMFIIVLSTNYQDRENNYLKANNQKKINIHRYNRYIISFALILLLSYGGFTIAATHDYLAWNRNRWQALSDLMQENQIAPNYIDGGYEFNGWYLYDTKYKRQSNKSFWWVDRDDYVIASGLIKGYQEIKRYPFKRWLLLSQGNIFVLQKETTKVQP